MGLADDARALVAHPGPQTCGLASLIEELGDELVDALLETDGPVPLTGLVRALRDRGYDVDRLLLGRHRRRECKACVRKGLL